MWYGGCKMMGIAVILNSALLIAAAGSTVFNPDFERGDEGWRLRPAYSVQRGAGMNGTAALAYENADPKLPYAFPSQKIRLEPGQTYRFSAF